MIPAERKTLFVFFSTVTLLVAAALGLHGCGRTLSKEARAVIAVGALAAKERAVAFSNIRPQLRAKDAADAPAMEAYLNEHSDGLNAQAAALADIASGIDDGGGAYEALLVRLRDEAVTARARAKNFTRASEKLAPSDDDQRAFIETHAAALIAQADALNTLAKLLPPPKQTE